VSSFLLLHFAWGVAKAKCILVTCVSMCLYDPWRMPTLLHGPRCNLGEWYGVPLSCAVFGGFAIGARVSLLWQHSAECKMSASACTRSVHGSVSGDFGNFVLLVCRFSFHYQSDKFKYCCQVTVKPRFHVKIKLFERILGLHGTTSEVK